MSSSVNTHAHAHTHASASTHGHAGPSRSGSAAGRASASTPEPLHLHLHASGNAHAGALGHMPPVMETMQTAALMDNDEGDGGGGGDVSGQSMRRRGDAGGASPRSSTSSSSTITPLQHPISSADLNPAAERSLPQPHTHTPGSRPAPPYHPTRTNTSLSAGILRGDAPTYLEAMSTPDLTSEAYAYAVVPAPAQPRQTMRGRTSETFRNLLHRTHLIPSRPPPSASSVLLPLHLRNASGSNTLLLRPISSHTPSVPSSPRTPGHGPGPGPNRHSNNPYRHSLANSSFHTPRNSSYSLVIGSPIPSTAVRAGFILEDLPRAGLSEDQMRFLASSEAVNLVGVRLDGPAAPGVGRERSRPGHGRTRSDGAVLAVSTLTPRDGWEHGEGADGEVPGATGVPMSAPLVGRSESQAGRVSMLEGGVGLADSSTAAPDLEQDGHSDEAETSLAHAGDMAHPTGPSPLTDVAIGTAI